MTTGERIASALVQQRGFVPLDETSLEGERLPERDRYSFVGVREYWGSMVTCAVLELASEDEQAVAQRAAEFYGFSKSLKIYADSVGMTRLGGFGLLAVLVAGPSSDRFRRWLASQKRGSAWRKDYCVVWLLDRALQAVFTHRGFPLTFYPGRRFFRDVLRGEEPDNNQMQRTGAAQATDARR